MLNIYIYYAFAVIDLHGMEGKELIVVIPSRQKHDKR